MQNLTQKEKEVKIRTGFVSNSSSSSFVVNLDTLSADELLKLLQYNNVTDEPQRGWRDHWTIIVDEDKKVVQGFTNMDNGDLDEYLKEQHIDDSKFTYDED